MFFQANKTRKPEDYVPRLEEVHNMKFDAVNTEYIKLAVRRLKSNHTRSAFILTVKPLM